MTYVLKPANIVFADTGSDWSADAPFDASAVHTQDLWDRYVIAPVAYRGGQYEVGLEKKLTKNAQEGRGELYRILQAPLPPPEWRIPSCPLLFAVFATLRNPANTVAAAHCETILTLLREDFSSGWVRTSTTAAYNAKRDLYSITNDDGCYDTWKTVCPAGYTAEVSTRKTREEDLLKELAGAADITELQESAAHIARAAARLHRPYRRYSSAPRFVTIRSEGGLLVNADVQVRASARRVAMRLLFSDSRPNESR